MSILYDFTFLLVALFALGFTIFIHELGHFLAARQRGLLIKRFSIGFGPKIFGWPRNGVEYRLSAIPFGGYVALPQLVDMGRIEGSDREQEEKESLQSWDENEAKKDKSQVMDPLPKIGYSDKMIVSVMGAVFNILLAFFLACILSFFGYEVSDAQLTTKIGYVADKVERWNPLIQKGEEVSGPGKKAGLQVGDEILEVDGSSVESFMDIQNRIITGKQQTPEGVRLVNLTILRKGQKVELEAYPVVFGSEEMRVIGIGPEETFFIEELTPDMPAIKAGLEIGDQPYAMDGQRIHSFSQLIDLLKKTDSNQSIAFTVRKG